MASREELLAKITEQGDLVRTMKADGKNVDEQVATLLELKKQYKDLTGEDVPGAKSKGKKDKKKTDKGSKGGAAADKGGDASAASGDSKKDKGKKGQNKGKKDKDGNAEADKKQKTKDKQEPSERFSFPSTEQEINDFWTKIDAFQTSLKFSEGRPEFTFYDGPPFATGQPHYGHLLAGTIKDVVTRYAHQTGHFVERRFGWDCHGLPVEYEIDKTLNIKGPDDVMKMGIDKYNDACRGIVMRYSEDWRETVTRLGRWIDFEKDYKTMYPWFMESVWWVFSEIYKQGLVYRGFKVMPFSTALATPLSNFEANQDMHDVTDPSVTAMFAVEGEENTFFLAWTTTPWTLPSNLALCVHPDMPYVKLHDKKRDQYFYAHKNRVFGKGCLYKEGDKNVAIVEEMLGKDLKEKRYKPLFPYFANRENSFRVLADTYVTDDSGTGIVHNAPGHGEDDFRVCLAAGVITSEDVPCPLDGSGKYTDEVPDFKGVYIKDADKEILARLKAEGKIFSMGNIVHAYPHCWRSGTPLIRKTVDSWFVRVEDIKSKLLDNNDKTYWVPNNIREGRFRNWLADARDWAISRNRFWGTPIPLWMSDDGEEVVCVGSIQELRELSGNQDIHDLHRENIDHITIPSRKGKGVLRRVPQVFDCWFESGSMPYAQKHYPFENKERFEKGFPADFIAEGIDQTRGWFYTLLVIGTALFNKPAWKNLIVNGLVLASDGKKMSKRLKNYPDPNLVLKEDGADALRLYLITSPAVHAESLRFERSGVQALTKDVFLPWLNALRFFQQQAERLATATGEAFTFDADSSCPSHNRMDRWMLAFTQSLIAFVHTEMQAYRLYTVVPKLLKYVDNLTNWYVRFNRQRLKGANGDDDAKLALWTLAEVLFTLTKLMAPFTPFFSEWVYQQLRPFVRGNVAPVVGTGPASWTPDQVAEWLATEDCSDFATLFREHGMTGQDVLDLTHEDLTSMGVHRCTDRKRVLRRAHKLITSQPFGAQGSSDVREINGVREDDSVHFLMLPQPKDSYHDDNIVRAFDHLKRVIEAGRVLRDQANMPVKYPLKEVVVISKTPHALDDVRDLEDYLRSELNVLMLTTTKDESEYNVSLKAKPDFKKLGARLKGEFKAVDKAIRELSHEQLVEFQQKGEIVINGHALTTSDINLSYEFDKAASSKYLAYTDADILVLLDVVPDQAMVDEGLARDVTSRIQKMRKTAGLQPQDQVQIYYKVVKDVDDVQLGRVLDEQRAYMTDRLDRQPIHEGEPGASANVIITDTVAVKAASVTVWLVRP